MNPVQPKPNTLEAVALLGWKPEDEAVRFLLDDCIFDPPLTDSCARGIWRKYRDAVEALGERDLTPPTKLPITNFYEDRAFREFSRRYANAPNLKGLVRVDPFQLTVHQLYVVTERSGDYRKKVETVKGWIDECVLCVAPPVQMQVKAGPGSFYVNVPHMEFMLGVTPNGTFQIQQLARFVGVTEYSDRMMLWAGYHRSYARIASMAPEAIERSLLVALTTDGDFMVSPVSPNQGVRDILTGTCPPLFSDFFDERFFMRIKLRKKRYEL